MRIVRDGGPADPVLDVALGHALLLRVARGELPATLRVYRPAPTVAFGKLDRLRDGYERAIAAAREHGFEPVLRGPGGHAAAYDSGTIGFDLVTPADRLLTGVHERFRSTSEALASSLSGLGVDARVGAVPGEYCRGDYSVNARGRVKLAGTAQRVVRGGVLLGGFVTVSGSSRLRAVLEDVYAALALDWDPSTLAALEDEAPGVTVGQVGDAVVAALGSDGEQAEIDAATRELATSLTARHTVGA